MSYEDNLIACLSRHQHAARKPALLIAEEVLGRDLNLNFKGHFALRGEGGWTPATLDQVMVATNTKLAREGKPQVTLNPKWVVTLPAISNPSPESPHAVQ